MKLLLADDDPLTLEALSACMVSEGFDVLTAKDGEEALSVWREGKPDLICLDIMMPQLNGFEVCTEIRRKDKHVPILFISAKNEEADLIAGLDLGADDFIHKPFTRGEVMARVRACARRAKPVERDKGFTVQDLNVHPKQLMAKRGDEVIELSPREISMLELLHENKNNPVTRDAFLDRCWGVDYFPDSRTLDQHILLLRKKVEKNPSEPEIILTVRGVGYRFSG